MPVIKYPVRIAAKKARSKNNIRLILQNRFYKTIIFIRVVLQIGILNNDNIT